MTTSAQNDKQILEQYLAHSKKSAVNDKFGLQIKLRMINSV